MGSWHQDGLVDWLLVVMWLWLSLDGLCGLVVTVPGYGMEMCFISCEVRTEFMLCRRPIRPPLWSSDQSPWPQIQRSGNDSLRYETFWEVVGLERGPLSLVSTIVELLERKSSGSGLESREYSHSDPSRLPRGTLYLQKLAVTSPTRGGRSVGQYSDWKKKVACLNNWVGDSQQQSNQSTAWFSCDVVAKKQRCKHENRRISIVGNRHRTTTSEDIKGWFSACATVIV
jgi:hypothetical protein